MFWRLEVACLCVFLQVGCAAQLAPRKSLLDKVVIENETYRRGDFVVVVYFDFEKQLKTVEGYIKAMDSSGITLSVLSGKKIAFKDIESITQPDRTRMQKAKYLSVFGGISQANGSHFNAFGFAARTRDKNTSHDFALEIFFKEGEAGWFAVGPSFDVHPFRWKMFSPYISAGCGVAGASFAVPLVFHSKIGMGLQIVPSKAFAVRSEVRRDGFGTWSFTSFRMFVDLTF